MDPLVKSVDLSFAASDPDAVIYQAQNLWYNWKFKDETGMTRLGDRFTWTDGAVSRLADVKAVGDERLEKVPGTTNNDGWPVNFTHLRRP